MLNLTSGLNAATLLRFVLAAVVGSGATLGIASVAQAGPTSLARQGPSGLYRADSSSGPIGFGLIPIPGGGQPVPAPPADQGAQLVSFKTTTVPPNPAASFRPAWWSADGFPRVPPITQFDGGPLQGKNCQLASGAMLARLGYGIVTTGSQLRALQPKQTGGTSLADLDLALSNGWGVQFPTGSLTALQFRTLIYAGAGAVLDGVYGALPASMRLQPDFLGAHAIYVDGFRPPQGGQPAAYYVIDPIGRPWEGYRGEWLDASAIEAFALALTGNGTMLTAWAFAGGVVPFNHPVLPPNAYPTPAPGPSGEPSPSVPLPSASVEPSPSEVPLPTAAPSPSGGDVGDDGPSIPPIVSKFSDLTVTADPGSFTPVFDVCLAQPPPAYCPAGLPGSYGGGASPKPGPTVPPYVNLLYANAPQPGVVQVIFKTGGGSADFEVWTGNGAPQEPTSLDPATLGGQDVWIAAFPVQLGQTYQFLAGATGEGAAGLSALGTVSLGQ